MIILKNENDEIVEIFDVAKEFKNYIKEWLQGAEKELLSDGELENNMLMKNPINEESFYNQLSLYLDMTQEKVEIK